jgi:hypothetical protein
MLGMSEGGAEMTVLTRVPAAKRDQVVVLLLLEAQPSSAARSAR